MKIRSIIYWIATVSLCGLMLYSATMYLTNTKMVQGYFEHLNYPIYLVLPLAIAKIAGVVMILSRKIKWLTEWAYAGFFFDMILAFAAHQYAEDGAYLLSLLGICMLLISYFLGKLVRT